MTGRSQGHRVEPEPATVRELLRFERLLSELSAQFSNLALQDIDRAIEDGLARIVEALDLDRSTLTRVVPSTRRVEMSHSHKVAGVLLVRTLSATAESDPWVLAMLTANKSVVFERLGDLPAEASAAKEAYRRIGLKSHVTMPIIVAGELHGGLSFGCVRGERRWSEDLLGRMRLLAEIFGSALSRMRAQQELDKVIGFGRLASNVLASLVRAAPGDEIRAVLHGLRQIGEFLGADRVRLLMRTGDEPYFRVTQHWEGEDLHARRAPEAATDTIWISGRVIAGHVIRLADLSELPPEAGKDRAALEALHIRSLLIVPIWMTGRVSGALSLASIRKEREWPDSLMPGVHLLAEVFGSLQEREAAEHKKLAAELEAVHWRERLAHLVRVHTAGEMSVALAHEIAQPLGAIENYALAASRRTRASTSDMARVLELIDKVLGQSRRAGDVVTRMRSLVQRHEVNPELIDIERAVDECVCMVKMEFELRDIRIDIEATKPLPTIMVDRIYLQQVMLNLLRNAMEATELAPPGGAREVTVFIKRSHCKEIVIEVADHGMGIAEGDLEHVFESFYSTKSTGLGVGLAICRRLIEAHGGALCALHEPGGGARFRFTLPVETRAV